MTDDQINIAIAENVLGWRQSVAGHPQSGNLVVIWTDNESNFSHFRKPAKFCNDLNAMHEAEMTLPLGRKRKQWDNSRSEFRSYLRLISGYFGSIHATARQRAEAFLRTLGKWEESE
jgi:hypothetical protein